MPTTAVAALAETVAELINGYVSSGQDSTGQEMVKVRKAKIEQLRQALAQALDEVYPDPHDHNRTIINALARR